MTGTNNETPAPDDDGKSDDLCKEIKREVGRIHKKDPLLSAEGIVHSLGETEYKAEVDLVEKYQSFVAEILRLSLLGIAVFGFLFKEIIQDVDAEALKAMDICTDFESVRIYGAYGVIMFVLSIGCALYFRYKATEGIRYYIMALRFMKKGEKPNAEYSLCRREKVIGLCRVCKAGAAIFLWLGGGFVALSILGLLAIDMGMLKKPVTDLLHAIRPTP